MKFFDNLTAQTSSSIELSVFILSLLLTVIASPDGRAQSFSVGDTILVKDTDVLKKTTRTSDSKHTLSERDTAIVRGFKPDYYQVSTGKITGWISPRAFGDKQPSVGDTISLSRSISLRESPTIFGEKLDALSDGDRVLINQIEASFYLISSYRGQGWIEKEDIMTEKEVNEYRKILARKRERQREQERKRRRRQQRKREREEYFERLREKGYTIALRHQGISTNSAGGVSVSLRLQNISESKVVKYATMEWQLFNTVGDPTSGQNGTSSVTTTKFVGPLEPGDAGTVRFDNIWYSSVGRCVLLRRLEVEHVDGSTFTYVNDLQDIDEYADDVRLSEDCSYEAQQHREEQG